MPKFAFVDESLVLAVIVIVIVYLIGISRRGRLLRATREDALAARALGASVWHLRVLFFTVSGGIAALSGAMYAHHAGAVTARDFYLGFTFTTLAMLIIGGATSLWGAVVGTVLVTAIGRCRTSHNFDLATQRHHRRERIYTAIPKIKINRPPIARGRAGRLPNRK